ncbi:MAG: GatB/YqeY domain-containing protein [Tenacibaculum sp.]
MSAQQQVADKIKQAIKLKDTVALTALRALKSAFMLANTEVSSTTLTEQDELKIIQKQVKQRKDSAALYVEQNRKDLATAELAEAAVIEQFLPKALSEEEIKKIVVEVIDEQGAKDIKDMANVVKETLKRTAGQADGKTVAKHVKVQLL